MRSVEIRWSGGPMPVLPDPSDPGVALWRDLDGQVCALGERLGERRRFSILGLASYDFDLESPEVVISAAAAASRAVIVDQFYRTVLPILLQARGFEALHASAVRTPGGVVALCAPKESGKSTLAWELGRRGHVIWADDAVVLEFAREGIASLALPFEVRLRAASAAHFGQSAEAAPSGSRETERIDLDLLERAQLAALLVLDRARDGARRSTELRRVAAGDAFAAVLAHAYCFSLDDAPRKQAMMRHFLALTAQVPAFELRYPTGLGHLDAIVAAIESTVDVPASNPAGAAR